MNKFLSIFMLGAALTAPIAMNAQERVYEDKGHHDSHSWNNEENERYRNYLKEHHKKYREFNRMSRRDQDAYWNWRHSH